MMYLLPWQPVFDNNIEAFVPELWANEAIALLEENMIAGAMVHRDFNNEVASYGDTIHTRKVSEFTAEPYANNGTIVLQDTQANEVDVKLDTVLDVSFKLSDLDRTRAFKDLVNEYIRPAVLPVARILDRKILGQAALFMGNSVGGDRLSASNSQDQLVELRKKLNLQKCPEDGRNLFWTPSGEATVLKTDLFISAERAGQSETQREANLGRKFGFNNWMSLNAAEGTSTAGTAGTCTVAGDPGVATFSSALDMPFGTYFTVVGDAQIHKVASRTGAGPYVYTSSRPRLGATAANAVMVPYLSDTVDTTHAAGHTGWIKVDNNYGVVGNIVNFTVVDGSAASAGGTEYVIVATKAGYIMLDRGLDASLIDNGRVRIGPPRQLNFAFNRNAITLVNRPLDMPAAGTGVRAAVINSHNMSMRVMMSYNQSVKAQIISIDAIFGVKTLDTQYGAVLVG